MKLNHGQTKYCNHSIAVTAILSTALLFLNDVGSPTLLRTVASLRHGDSAPTSVSAGVLAELLVIHTC